MIDHLFLHNIGYTISAILGISLGLFVLIRDPRKLANRLYFISNFCFAIYVLGYILGVNSTDSVVSQHYLLLTMINLFTVCTTAHLAFELFKKAKRLRYILPVMYGGATLLAIFFLTDISRFVLPSSPALYFKNYFNPGPFYIIFFIFFVLVAGYFFYALARLHGNPNTNIAEKNRIKYFILSFGWGYGVGTLAFLPTYGVHYDPVYSSVLGLYTIPLAYTILKYDLLDIHVVAKNALRYALTTALVGFSIILINFINNYLIGTYSNFPIWVIPFASAIVVVLVGVYVWRQIREGDLLKYEFINNISHKFRTPLTHIRWLAEELRTQTEQTEKDKSIEQIQYASMRLFELTNIVIDVARDSTDAYLYQFALLPVQEILSDVYKNHSELIARKNLNVSVDIGANIPDIYIDKTRMQFAIQILFENALAYTPAGGDIMASVRHEGGEVIISVKDSGIGIEASEIDHLFSKFYRTKNARHADTEGMGIGLFMAKNITEKHHGRIWAESQGIGKGSTFSLALPVEHN